jgi:hypothetical protein
VYRKGSVFNVLLVLGFHAALEESLKANVEGVLTLSKEQRVSCCMVDVQHVVLVYVAFPSCHEGGGYGVLPQ